MLPQMLPLLDDPWRLHWRQLWRTVAVEWCWRCCGYILWYIISVFILILIYHPISCRTLACSMEFSARGWWCLTFHCYRKGYSQLTDWICHRGRWMTIKVVCKILGFKTLTQCLRFNAEGNGKSKNLKVAMILYGSIGKELGEFKEWSEVPGSRWKVIMWMVYFVEQTFWNWTWKLAWSGSDRRHSGLPVRFDIRIGAIWVQGWKLVRHDGKWWNFKETRITAVADWRCHEFPNIATAGHLTRNGGLRANRHTSQNCRNVH